jgi:uncharacterized protein (TIRG00374 family)
MRRGRREAPQAASGRDGSIPAMLRRAGSVLRPLVAILLTAFVLWRADPSAVVEAAARADLRWIGVAILLVVVDRALMAYRWLVLLTPIPRIDRPPLGALMRIFFTSTFAGTFLPASVGGDAVRAYGLARLRVAPGVAVASVLVDRLLGVLSILLVCVAGLLLADSGDLWSNQAIGVSLLVAGAACAAGAAVVFSAGASRLAQRFAARLPVAPLRAISGELLEATRAYRGFRGELTNVLGSSVAVQILRVIQAYCLGRALGIEASPAIYFALVPLVLLVMLLPVTVNGLGTSQVAFVWFFGRVGVPHAEAFALSVLFVALGVVGNLPGGLLYAFGPRSAL